VVTLLEEGGVGGGVGVLVDGVIELFDGTVTVDDEVSKLKCEDHNLNNKRTQNERLKGSYVRATIF
jgi:hypothetical protein